MNCRKKSGNGGGAGNQGIVINTHQKQKIPDEAPMGEVSWDFCFFISFFDNQ